MTTEPIFDVHKRVASRNKERMVIFSVFSAAIILVGLQLIPENFKWELAFDAMKTWNGWALFGVFLVAGGILNLAKTAIFYFRSRGTSGEWHFRLTRDELLWQVPDHAHGPEIGFKTSVSNIKELEFRTISRFDEKDEREYWIHFRDRDSIPLQSYSGVSVSWLVSKIHEAGVPYNETFIEG